MKDRAFKIARNWEISYSALKLLWNLAELPAPFPHPLAVISAGQVATLREAYAYGLMTGLLVGLRKKNGCLRPLSDHEPWELERQRIWEILTISRWYRELCDELHEVRRTKAQCGKPTRISFSSSPHA